jgi:4-amino-4-deoxy-L-arabinose transferase-like glycosyltransferase
LTAGEGRLQNPLARLLGLAALIRLAWVAFATRAPDGIHDPTHYLLHAIDLAEGRGYALPQDGRPTAYYPVGYPLVLSALFRILAWLRDPQHVPTETLIEAARRERLVDHAEALAPLVWTASLFNVALGVGSVALVFWLARRLAGTRAAVIAALLTACFPNLIFHTSVLLTETLFTGLLLSALALLLAAPWREGEPRLARLFGFGLLVGAAALVRPVILVLLAALPLALLIGRFGWRRTVGATLLAGVGASLLIAPWSLRNLQVMGAPILISSNFGDNLCIGHYPGARGHFAITPVCRERRGYGRPFVNPHWEVRHDAEQRRKALDFARANLADEPALLLRKLYYLLRHDHNGIRAAESYGKRPFLAPPLRSALIAGADLYYYAVLALAIPGLLLLLRGPRDPRRVMLVLTIVALLSAPLPFFGNPRFHVPVLPLLAVAAGAAVSALLAARRRRPPSVA